MRPYSKYLEQIKSENVHAKYNLAGTTPPNAANLKISGTGQIAELCDMLAGKLGVSRHEVTVAPGGSQALFQILAAVCRPGDTVLIERPVYEPFVATARFLGIKIRHFLRSGHFDKDLRSIKKAARGCKAILISNPHCPLGYMYTPAQLSKLSRLGPRLIVDEVYLPLFSDGDMTNVVHQNAITISGLSKSTGHASARIGFIRADRRTIREINRVGLNLHVDMPGPSIQVAIAALKAWPRLLSGQLAVIGQNHKLLSAFLTRHPTALAGAAPQGSFICLHVPAAYSSGTTFANHLRKKGVWVRAGELFSCPRTVRLHVMLAPAKFKKALKLIEEQYG